MQVNIHCSSILQLVIQQTRCSQSCYTITSVIDSLTDPLVKISSKHSQLQTGRVRELEFCRECSLFIPHYVSHVKCQASPVTCHVSHVTCHLSPSSGGARQWRVCYLWGLPRLVWITVTLLETQHLIYSLNHEWYQLFKFCSLFVKEFLDFLAMPRNLYQVCGLKTKIINMF